MLQVGDNQGSKKRKAKKQDDSRQALEARSYLDSVPLLTFKQNVMLLLSARLNSWCAVCLRM